MLQSSKITMPEINIWGESGCKLSNGKLCDVCCWFYEVAIDSQIKPEHTPCPYQKRVSGQGEGCDMHGMFPDCRKFHCPSYFPNTNLDLIAIAYSSNLVTVVEAEDAVRGLAILIKQESATEKALEYMFQKSQEYKILINT